MTRRRLLPLLAASLPAVASTNPADTDINSLLEPIRATHKVPALIGGIVTTSGLSAAGVTGVRKRDDSTPATLSDLWHLGSMTKAMTAT
jgi:CubicO group peptidase (beta-lactamase class C family)